jgi:iduronate 2-sulfatase
MMRGFLTYAVMSIHTRLLSLVLVLMSFVPAISAADIDVYLLAGQSNMDGRGKTADLDAALKEPLADVPIWYRQPLGDSKGWQPLAPGFSIPPGHKGGLPGPTFGIELSFARTLLAKQPKQRIAFIKGSRGGTTIEQWGPGEPGKPNTQGECYRLYVDTITKAIAALKADGHAPTIRALLWHQGESNSKDTAEAYQAKLEKFIARIREDVGNPELPVLVGEVIDNKQRDGVRAAQKAIPGAVKNTIFVTVDGLTSSDKGTHFDTKSVIELGQRFAAALPKR